MEYSINGEKQTVKWTNLPSKPLHPVVAFYGSSRTVQLLSVNTGAAPMGSVWDTVSSGVSVTEDGTLATSTSSGNNHAVVAAVGSTKGLSYWEFEVVKDEKNNEMVCLGAALMPVSNSRYDSSPDLWMYRGYNGALYSQGTTLSKKLDKFHPGDKVRFMMNHEKSSISVQVNGKCFGPVFTGIPFNTRIHPAVSYYGSNRSVKLVDAGTVAFTSKSDSITTTNAGSGVTSTTSTKAYAILNNSLSAAVSKYWSWEFKVETAGTGSAVGFAVGKVSDGNYDSNKNLFTYVPGSGGVYNAGSFVKNVATASKGQHVSFYLDHESRSVSLSVNGVGQGNVFSSIPDAAEYYPVVCTFNSGHRV